MIGALRGTVLGLIRGTVVIDVGGVGYRVWVTADTLASVHEGDAVVVWTHLAVRENSQDLYGFIEKDDLTWFELLLTVSGVGPKSALAILNAVSTDALNAAISTNDAASLARAHGIGKKTAEKIVLELREKVGSVATKTGVRIQGSDAEVVDALVGLGYSQKEARDAVHDLPETATTTEEKIREAIKIASRSL
jgi:Holliday junction DNA helicase RuvA